MSDIAIRLEERATSYEQSGPSAHHTAALLREAKAEIEQLRADFETVSKFNHRRAEVIERFVPADCRDRSSCIRHGECMYIKCSKWRSIGTAS